MSYTADDIKSLTFREGVRTRIQMYLGSANNEGTYQAFKEIINNATDEAICGYGKLIEVTVDERDNSIRIRDYGRGVPFLVKEDGTNILVDIYTKSHTGGKFDDHSYKNVGGLNGVGGSCVCLSSLAFEVNSYRDGKKATAFFEKGILKEYAEFPNNITPDGTEVWFIPDPEVFKDEQIGYSYDRICQDIKNISYLYTGITFRIINAKTGKKVEYCAKNGIVDFIKDNNTSPLHNHIITETVSEGEDKVEIAFQWGGKKEQGFVFVNGLLVPEGGSPVTGAKTAITRTFNSLAKQNFDGDVIRQGLFYVINCSVAQPSFANQTKSKINNPSLRSLASNAFSNALKDMKLRYPSEFSTIVDLITKITKADAAAERARRQVLDANKEVEKNQKKKVFASDKLKDAEFLGQDSTLLICEGDSALGAMAQARDYTKYGLLAIRGKIINCLSNDEEKIFNNEEIKLLMSALNISAGHYNPAKLRYGKVAICTDADSDGYHIGLLVMAVFAYLAPDFIKEGRLYWLRSPLYIVKNNNNKCSYYFNDEEFNKVRSKVKGTVTRAKGLGKLSSDIAHESMFTPEYQRMEKLEWDQESMNLLYDLMGEDVDPRRDFIMNKIDFSKVRE